MEEYLVYFWGDMETCDVSFFFFYILYHIIVGNLVTRARWGRFTVIHSVSSLAEIINNRQKARRSAGLHILMLVCIGSVFREGLALCWLCPDIHSHTISGSEKKKKGMHHTALLHMDQRGVCHAAVGLLERLPTWKYHIPVLCGGPVCNCVLSDLQSPSHSFLPDIFLQWIYFSFFLVFWQRVHSWPNLDLFFLLFLPPRVPPANDKTVCGNCTLYEKEGK